MLIGKAKIILLIIGLITKGIVKMSEYFPKPKCLVANVKVELDLSNYAIKADLKIQQVLIHQILLKKLI